MDEQGLGQNEFNTTNEYKVIFNIIKFSICSFKHFMPSAEASFTKKGYMLRYLSYSDVDCVLIGKTCYLGKVRSKIV